MAKTIITLGREYCTGGRYIAKDVARALGIKLYDKELITMAAKNSGLSEEAVAASEKRHTHSLLYSLYTMGNELPLGDQVFILKSRIIKQLADEGPCVIVGRCANFILKGRPNLFSVFLHADRTTRMQRVIENYGVEPGGAARAMDIMDSRRRTHCLHYTGQELGNARLYDLCVNTSDYGLERTVELILEAINTRTEQSSAVETVPVRSASFPEPEEDRIPGEISLA